ncbi:AbrB family transcriptional regulator [Chelativorans salis]|uniref:AbrB family transcriptional regulator n=1 Tax=Chelativorans salis TaxID=2978478 RepID=A0ABT2LQ57_9HYPH|nr:AbrB family transcriptional regulator [Chelativorans sp. EGI FJ00035]MCT7376685.1 AbrB family transcriptional regulator [Chelativorans sp. EGI FJ00035]
MRQDSDISQSISRASHVHRLLTLAIAAAGAALFWAFELPLPFLFGAMTACLIAALVRLPLASLPVASKLARTVLGVAVGASLTPELMARLPQMLGSIAFVPLYVAVMGAVGIPYFHRLLKYDLATSYYSAMPGGLQDMLVFGQEAGANLRALSLIHATRILLIVTIAPVVISVGFNVPLTRPTGAPVADIPIVELALMAGAAIIGWKGGERIGLFGATIIGPLILAGLLSLTGLIHARPPALAIQAAQFFIGVGVGVGYVGITLYEIRRDVLAGALYVVILAVLALIVTGIVVHLGFADPLDGFLAFAPGGQAEMTVLAIVVGADLGFVVVHHLLRVILIIAGAPLVGAMIGLSKRTATEPGGGK